MTADQPTAATDSQPRPLRRRATERVIGGVAAGLADYLNVDPLLIRAAFVGLMIFGGAGLVLYVGAWLLIPVEGHAHAIVDDALRRLGLSARGVATVVLVAIGGLIVLSMPIGGPVEIDGSSTEVWIVLLLVVLGIVLLSRREAEAVPSPPPAESRSPFWQRPFGLSPFRLVVAAFLLIVGFFVLQEIRYGVGLYLDAWTLIVGIVVVLGIVLLRQGGGEPRVVAAQAVSAHQTGTPGAMIEEAGDALPRFPRSPLGWYVVAAALIMVGALAVVDQGLGTMVLPGQFFGAVLAVVGIGLLVGSWWGHARVLIVPALLILPIAVAAAFVTAPLDGGFAEREFVPVTVDELRDEYRIVGGGLTLDLRELEAADEQIEIAASVAFGHLVVILPENGQLEIDSEVGAGESVILGTYQAGTNLIDRYVRGSDGPRFILDLEAGIGEIQVIRREGI
jgi:phage shock protein PspC (stress-responsive transcriptional regulator)